MRISLKIPKNNKILLNVELKEDNEAWNDL